MVTAVVELQIDVQGMSCATCAGAIEDSVGALSGVSDVAANYATDEVSVSYDSAAVETGSILTAIEDAGYEPVTDELSVAITDMSCANCSGAVEDAVGDLPGVVSVSANFAADEATVTVVPGAANRATVAAAIEDAGYTPVGGETDDEDARESARTAELTRQRRLTLLGVVLSAPMVGLLIDRFLLGGTIPETVAGVSIGWGEFALASVVQIALGREFYENSLDALRNGRANMDVLIALGSSTAYGYSVLALTGVLASAGLYFDTAALILTFITLGNYLEARSKGRASAALRSLLELEADTASVVDSDGTEREVPVEELAVGDRFRVRPGERIPTDGEVIDGESAVDESTVTGESVPVSVEPGDEVIGTTVNETGTLLVEATKVGSETAIQRIVQRVKRAQSRQPEIQRVADRISAYFVPAVIANATLWAVAWFFAPEALSGAAGAVGLPLAAGGPAAVGVGEFAVLVFAAAVLIACPCALGLSTPAATMVGTALGASRGILFDGGDVIERVADTDAVVFDKTGTITTGEMELTDVRPITAAADGPRPVDQSDAAGADERTEDAESVLLRAAATAEYGSEHPIGEAIVAGTAERGIERGELRQLENLSGKGIRAMTDEGEVLVGKPSFLAGEGIETGPVASVVSQLQQEGKTTVVVARDGALLGVLAVADGVRETAAETVAELHERGLAVHLLTGDTEQTARAVASEVGIDTDNVRAEVLPEDKADTIEAIQTDDTRAMMVGDGVNDAPALATAHVGCAVGSGTDVAIEAADLTLMRSDPGDVVSALNVAEGTLSKIRQNLFWALGYNTAMIPLASLGLLQPVLAAAAMAASSVSVLSNSLLFRRYDPDGRYWLRRLLE